MKSTGKIIYEVRTEKGISQEDLARMAKVNLRTIQRIENDLTEPRNSTINLIFGVLEIDQQELRSQTEENKLGEQIEKFINIIFLVLLNLAIATIVLYLTSYETANIYSKTGAFCVCVLLPFLIVSLTGNSTKPMRLVKFGSGFVVLIFFLIFQVKITTAMFSGAIPFSLLGLTVLFYGDFLPFKKLK